MEGFLTPTTALWLIVALALLTVVFLVLWLRARGGASAGDTEARNQLRAAQNELRLLKGDSIQAKRDHAAEVEKLNKELETLRAVAGGRVPPELEEWKARALEAEKQIQVQLERHRAEIEKIAAAVGPGGASPEATMISPGGVRERMETLERELATTRSELEAMKARHEAELAALSERLSAEKAAALTAQTRRHTAEMEALRRRLPAEFASDESIARELAAVNADELASPSGVPDGARFPFLQGLAGADRGLRFYLPYDVATIGRSETNTVVIQESMASRTHAEIRFDGAEFTLRDNNSTNGTLLNQELVASAPLDFGDVIAIGETQLRFTCEAFEKAETDPAFAEMAYGAMVKLAPNCRPALRGLDRLKERDATRPEEAGAALAKSRRKKRPSEGGETGERRPELS